MRWKILLAALGIIFLVSGCAGNRQYLPKHALDKPREGVSIPHPVEIERERIKTITVFSGIMDAGLFTEVVAGGGVWPALAQKFEGIIIKGYAYLSGISYWGDFLLTFVFNTMKEELIGARVLYFNRDAGWAYSLMGEEVGEKEVETSGKEKNVLSYNPKKFDEDKLYRREIFNNFGTILSSGYLIQEIKVGSPEWEEYKKNLFIVMPNSYKMANGQIRISHLPLDMYRQQAVEMPGFTGTQRYLNRATINLATLPFITTSVGVLALAGVAGEVAAAGIDDDWHGHYGRAQTIRYAMAPVFRQICSVYKAMLAERNNEIERLKNKCSKLEQKGGLK